MRKRNRLIVNTNDWEKQMLSMQRQGRFQKRFGTLGAYGWSGMLQLLTFAGAGIIIALLTNQREIARVRALVAEREAVLRANQLEAMFESMSDGVVVYNKQGQVLHTNAAAHHIFGLGASPPQDEAHLRQELLLQAAQRNEQGQ